MEEETMIDHDSASEAENNKTDSMDPSVKEETASDDTVKKEICSDNSDNDFPEKRSAHKIRHYRTPLYIAACIFLIAIMLFAGKQCFFNTDINGTWGMTVKGMDGKDDMVFNLSFDDTEVRFQTGGTVYIGRLTKEDENGSRLTDENGNSMLMLNMNLNGKPFVFKFDYEFTGNAFTGRTLKLTDLSGMFYEPDTKDSDAEEVKKRKNNTEFVQRDNVTYYIWNFTPSVENYNIKTDKSFKADSKLIGSWLYKTEETAYPYTITFHKDGTFEQHSYETEIHGLYSVKDGVCTLRYTEIANAEREIILSYKTEDKILTLSQEYEGSTVMERKLTKTDSPYSYKSDIK